MAELSITDYTQDNLVTATKPLITVDDLQLESGEGEIVRGEVLVKGTTGLVKIAADTDTVYAIALTPADSTSAAADIVYSYDCSVRESELTYGAGTIENFRDKFVTETRILVEE